MIARRRAGLGKQRGPATVSTHLLLLIGCVVTLYPLLWLLSASFKTESAIFNEVTNLWPGKLYLANYSVGWSVLQEPFWVYLRNSLVLALLAVIGSVASSCVVGYAFAKLRFPLRRMWFALMLSTIMLPVQVTLVPQYILFFHLHWVGTWLPLIVPNFLATNAFFVFLMVQFMRGIPPDLEDAAQVDGCGAFRTFFWVIVPLSQPAMLTTAILSFIYSWDDFLAPLVYLSNGASYTVPLALRLFLNETGQSIYGPMFAMSVISLVPVILCFLIFQRHIIQGIATTGLKG